MINDTSPWLALPQAVLHPDIYLVIILSLSTEAGNEWEVNVLRLEGSNRSYLLDIDFDNSVSAQWAFEIYMSY